ncbi:MAG: GNAT family N-acetyltransferase [Candidatus Omnitrophota bacterium]
MEQENNIIIRKFMNEDREDVRRIASDTAFMHKDAENFFPDTELLADALTCYFTDYEPESCFVAAGQDGAVGYIIGAKDTALMNKIFINKILPRLAVKSLKRGILLNRKILKFFLHIILSFLKGEFITPDFSKQYPATLHINIDKNFRGRKLGKRLIEHYLGFLREKGIRGVNFGTRSESAKLFFIKLGFTILFQGKRSYMKYITGELTTYYIFGKQLSL